MYCNKDWKKVYVFFVSLYPSFKFLLVNLYYLFRIPLKAYIFLAMLTLGTMGFSNSSLAYLNYPTQVIFKCCKLIPVMIGSIVIQHKRYNIIDFSAAICMCIGLSLFTLADSQLSPNFNIFGEIKTFYKTLLKFNKYMIFQWNILFKRIKIS